MKAISLREQYDGLNRRYFGGRLPRVPVRSCALPGLDGEVYDGAGGRARMVRINRNLRSDPEKERRVLLHEMVHVWAGDLCGAKRRAHGKRWKNRMLRLARQGEAWAADEAAHYLSGLRRHYLVTDLPPERQRKVMAQPPITWHDNIQSLKDALMDLAHSDIDRRCTFGAVKNMAADTMVIDAADVPRKLPWLKGAWRNALREAAWDREQRRLFDAGAGPRELESAYRRIMRRRFVR